MIDEAACHMLTWVEPPAGTSPIARAQVAKISRRCRREAEAAVAETAAAREEQMLTRYGRLASQFSQEQLDELDRRWRERQKLSGRGAGRATADQILAIVDGDLVLSRCVRCIELHGGGPAGERGMVDVEQFDVSTLADPDYRWLLEAVWAHTYPTDEEREGNSSGS